MALIQCPECKKKISENAAKCPNCGYVLTPEKIAEIKAQEEKVKKGCGIGCLSIVVIFFVFYLIGSFSSSDSSKSNGSNASGSREVVVNNAWDGSVSQVKSWLNANLKDPNSLEFIEWSPVSKTKEGGFMVRVKYRAKNSFGGYVVENKLFLLNSAGIVISNIDY